MLLKNMLIYQQLMILIEQTALLEIINLYLHVTDCSIRMYHDVIVLLKLPYMEFPSSMDKYFYACLFCDMQI